MSKSQQILNLYSSFVHPSTQHKQNKSDNEVHKRLGAILKKNCSPYQKPFQHKSNSKQGNKQNEILRHLTSSPIQSLRFKRISSKQQLLLDSYEEPKLQSKDNMVEQQYNLMKRSTQKNLLTLIESTKRLLDEYKSRLDKAQGEKQQLEQEVQYWKSKSGY
ncbi:unnamed protein product [Paramecium primaurelia]|uniref:Uncharacterized protein n=1 Tax=Paramecium primaurelia TaxID=5886 RepID=A0A8S1JP87_PARPR|nr:unnamed protein product [Paramecium primaurelia]